MGKHSMIPAVRAVAAMALVASGSLAAWGAAEDPDASGTLQVPAMTLPFSTYASPEARQAFIDNVLLLRRMRAEQPATGVPVDIGVMRANTLRYMTPFLDKALALYPAKIEPGHMGGVAVDVVTPIGGVSGPNRRRVLINLHNGGFFVGGGISGRVEAVPVAGLGKIKVVAVDYRQGPEFKFPAASEDVAQVFQELLKHYPARNIGIYGCSAGGLLTAEVVAWLHERGLPQPGAVGIFCASAGGWAGGDSTYVTAAYSVVGLRAESPHFAVSDAAYFSAADMQDPLVAPIQSARIMATFPPTLVITGTRDVAMSSAVFTHAQLDKLGVEAELHVWDGLGHAFFLDPGLPESREAYAVIVKFFDRHLGR